jgi:RND family efflux transporter MFP subunit
MTPSTPTPTRQHRARLRRVASIAVTTAAALAVLALLAACSDEPAPMPQGPSAMKVQVLKTEQTQASARFELAGRIVAREPVLIHAVHDGLRVERVFVDAGQAVAAGQPLVQLDTRGLRAELQQARQARERTLAQKAAAQAQAAHAESRLRSADDEARRYAGVAASGAVSELDVRARRSALEQAQAERDAASQALMAAQAELAAAEATLRLAGEREGDGVLRAPVAGVVSERRVEVGTVVDSAAGPLFRLARAGDREFEASVDSSRLAGLRTGDAVEVLLAATGGVTPQRVTGRVRAIDTALAEDSRRGRLRVALSGVTGTSVPLLGSAATAVLKGAALSGVRLPASALQFDPEPWVYVVDEAGRVAKRRVALSGDGTVVTEGLTGGETVVRAAAALLSPGQRIEPIQALAGAVPLAHPATEAASATRLTAATQGAAK